MSLPGRPQSALRLVCALSEVALTKRISPAAAVALDVLLNPPGQRVPAASLLPALSGAAHRLCRPPQRLSSLQNGRRSRRHIRRQVLRSQLLARRHPCLPAALPATVVDSKMVEDHDAHDGTYVAWKQCCLRKATPCRRASLNSTSPLQVLWFARSRHQ